MAGPTFHKNIREIYEKEEVPHFLSSKPWTIYTTNCLVLISGPSRTYLDLNGGSHRKKLNQIFSIVKSTNNILKSSELF